MTPNDLVQLKNSVQLQSAVRMLLEYLLEHKELLQTAIQQQTRYDDSSATKTGQIADATDRKGRKSGGQYRGRKSGKIGTHHNI
jgi:hypothetical protein